jgi:hypothetical protein
MAIDDRGDFPLVNVLMQGLSRGFWISSLYIVVSGSVFATVGYLTSRKG